MDDFLSVLAAIVIVAAGVVLLGLVGILALTGVSTMVEAFSLKSRAERALQTKGLGEALRLYALEGEDQDVKKCLTRNLPNWPVRASLVSAATELVQLRSAATLASESGVPANLTGRLITDATDTMNLLWQEADKLASVKAQGMAFEDMRAEVGPEIEHLEKLAIATRQARQALAEWTLTDDKEIERAELNLRTLAHSMEAMAGA